jgi:hypothetical protein
MKKRASDIMILLDHRLLRVCNACKLEYSKVLSHARHRRCPVQRPSMQDSGKLEHINANRLYDSPISIYSAGYNKVKEHSRSFPEVSCRLLVMGATTS